MLWTSAFSPGWNAISLRAVFREGLNPLIRKQDDEHLPLNALIDLAIRLDNLSRDRKSEYKTL